MFSHLHPIYTLVILFDHCGPTMMTPSSRYPAIPGMYFFCRPNINDIASHCSVKNIFETDWKSVEDDLRSEFCKNAFAVKRALYLDPFVKPCAVRYDKDKFHFVIMFGPFHPHQAGWFRERHMAGEFLFYSGSDMHMTMAMAE